MERLTAIGDDGNVYRTNSTISDRDAWYRLATYEDTGLEPEEAFAAIDSAAKLIATMRNNKKAALWLKKYGPAEAGDTP